MRNILILALLLSSLVGLSAQQYEGKVGKYPIYFELDTEFGDGRAMGYYFYESQLSNIQLRGSYDGNTIELSEKGSVQADKKELFLLSKKADKLVGTWQNGGTTLPVELHKTNADFEKVKQAKLTFNRDSIARYEGKELVWLTEKYAEKPLFRLGNGFTKAQRTFANPILDTIHTKFAMIALDCDYAKMEVKAELVSDDYLSFSIFLSTYCGGAHPNHSHIGYNFDLSRMRVLDSLEDLYPGLDYYQHVKDKYQADESLDPYCEYFDYQEDWNYYSWIMTKSGIVITPDFAHALTPCEVGFLLTNEELPPKR